MIRSLITKLSYRNALPIAAAVALTAAPAFAAPVNLRPTTLGNTALQGVFDGITVGGPGIDVDTDQHAAALFHNNASGGSVATFVIELAGYAANTSFGIYQEGDSSNRAQVFSGSDTAGGQKLVSFLANGNILVNGVLAGTSIGSTFGFYIDVEDTGMSYFTEDDENIGNAAQALVFQGDNETVLKIDPYAAGLFTDNEWIIAFEDMSLAHGQSDLDYTDLVVLVESVHPVPVPAAAAIALPMLGLLGMRRAIRRKA